MCLNSFSITPWICSAARTQRTAHGAQRTTHSARRTLLMADRVLITTDDLEAAVRVNASLEGAGFDTAMVSSLDDVRSAVRSREPGTGNREPDAIVLTGGLHESTAQRLLAAAHEHAVSTLGLVEATDEDPNQIGRDLGLTGWLVKQIGRASCRERV